MATEKTPTNTSDNEADNAAARAAENRGDNARASWRFSADTIHQNCAHLSPEAKDLLIWSFNWCIDTAHSIRFEEFAERLGYSTNKLYKVFSGKDRHPTTGDLMDVSDALLKALRDFRRIEIQRAKLGRQSFVRTPTAARVFLACDLARESQTPVFIEGASHIGKTEAFKQYCVENNHGKSRLIELEAVSGLHGLIRAVAGAVGISPNGNAADLTERIKRAVGSDMVLIFDEVHLLANTYRKESFFACMEWIRRIYDFTHCGLVLSFTELGFKKAAVQRKLELEQIFRRGVHRINLGDRPTVGDIKAILGSWGLEMPARADEVTVQIGRETLSDRPYDTLKQLSAESGLKAVVERLRYAAKFAADKDEPLSWDNFFRAHLTIARAALAPATGWHN